jgi:hypothetical protein
MDFRLTLLTTTVAVLIVALALPMDAQTTGELGAFSALMVSPAGALPPVARDYGAGLPDRWTVSLRYGGWQYDVDDGAHNNVGLTIMHRVANTRTTVAISGAYLSLDCNCSVWGAGSVAARSIIWQRAAGRGLSAHFAMQEEVGGARFTGVPHASALSATATGDLGLAVPIGGARLALSILPGMGFGQFWSVDQTGSAWRPLTGAALSLSLFRGFTLDVGTQRVVIPRGPKQIGAGLSWSAQ